MLSLPWTGSYDREVMDEYYRMYVRSVKVYHKYTRIRVKAHDSIISMVSYNLKERRQLCQIGIFVETFQCVLSSGTGSFEVST